MRLFVVALAFLLGSIFATYVASAVVTFLSEKNSPPPLPDLGHKALPDLWVGHYTLLTFLVAVWYLGVVLSLFYHPDSYKIYVKLNVNIGILLFMRAFSIVVTIQPSPYGRLPPLPNDVWYYFFDYRNVFTSVGDNMFSAHTCFLTIPYLALLEYTLAPRTWLKLLVTAIYAFLVFWIVASHLHYTADVLVALYLCFSTWCALKPYFPIQPKKEVLYSSKQAQATQRNTLFV